MRRLQQQQRAFCDYLRAQTPAPLNSGARGWQVYRDLIYRGNESFLRQAFPVYRSLLSERVWHQEARRFLMEHRSASPFFHDISRAYVDWMAQRSVQALPRPFAADLVHYEWLELTVAIAHADIPPGVKGDGDLMLGSVVLTPSLRCARYDWPVDRISPAWQPVDPGAEQHGFMVYRDRWERVRFIRSNALSLVVVEALMATPTSGLAVARSLYALMPDAHLPLLEQQVSGLLTELREQQVVLGAVP